MPTSWSALLALADRLEPRLARAYLAAIARLRARTDAAEIARAISEGRPYFIPSADLPLFEQAMDPLVAGITAAVQEAGQLTAERFTDPLGIALRFDLMNQLAIEVARQTAAGMVTAISAETRLARQNVIRRAIEEGFSYRDAARLIRQMVGLTAQASQAVLNYRASLIELGLKRARVEAQVARYAAKKLRERALMISRTECLSGDTLVDAAMVGTAYRRWYDGPMVEILTANGRQFSATPNHPMLTRRGWIGAGELQEGDHLIGHDRQHEIRTTRDGDIAARPATIREIFCALADKGVVETNPGRPDDFHGDGSEAKIDILRPDRLLTVGRFSPLYQPLTQGLLADANDGRTAFCAFCRRLLPIDHRECLCQGSAPDSAISETAIDRAVTGSVTSRQGSQSDSGSIRGADLLDWQIVTSAIAVATSLEEQPLSLTDRATGHTALATLLREPLRAHSQLPGDDLEGEAIEIELDRVINIRFRPWFGHVYNLSTPHGYFNIDGIYTGNTINSMTGGQVAAWRQAAEKGLIPTDSLMAWMTTPDDRLCPRCLAMDGKQVSIQSSFPGGNPALHPNCRCVLVLVVAAAGSNRRAA